MSRQPEIEAILEAWWVLDHCSPVERSAALARLNQLLDAIIAKSDGVYNRQQIQSALWDRHKAFKAGKRRQDKIEIAQAALRRS